MVTTHINFKSMFSVALLVLLLAPVSVFAEVIRSFGTEMNVRADGSVTVTETITYDFEDTERHGIYRIIPTDHPQAAHAWYTYRFVDIELDQVRMDGEPVPFSDESRGSEFMVRIGDADRTITGLHTYEITYTVDGALFDGGDIHELYWNVTGNEWEVPIESVRTIVSMPTGAYTGSATCYLGGRGSTERCAVAETENVVEFQGSSLAPYEEVTIALGLNPDVVALSVREELRMVWFMLVAGIILLLGGIYTIYRLRTAHYRNVPVIAQYEPYEDVRPMYAGMLIDGMLDARDVTAGIVYLAEQGFLKITHLEKKFLIFDTSDYSIELRKDGSTAPGVFLPQVLKLLFEDITSVGSLVTLSSIKKSLPKQQLNQKILTLLRKVLTEELHTVGFFESTFSFAASKRVLGGCVGILIVLITLAVLIDPVLFILVGGFIILFLIGLTVAWNRRTEKGYEARNHLRGVKLFLSVTDTERFAFHNAPEKSPELFMQYLPYAIAFGVEEKWAKVFEGITIPNPSWYDGGNAGAFSAAAFASDMSTFSSSLSASSGSSASSGGGSSGGGAGGGGGGSW